MMAGEVTLPSEYTPELIRQVQGKIDAAEAEGVQTLQWEEIVNILVAASLAQLDKQIDSDWVGVSPDNRESHGGGLLRGTKAWRRYPCRGILG